MAQETLAWHPGFLNAIELELDAVRELLGFEKGRVLNQRSLLIDLFIVKKRPRVRIDDSLIIGD